MGAFHWRKGGGEKKGRRRKRGRRYRTWPEEGRAPIKKRWNKKKKSERESK